jgi:hypothetical protein
LKSFLQFNKYIKLSREKQCETMSESNDCSICQEPIPEGKGEVRGCGHVTCLKCDLDWRRRAQIGSVSVVTDVETVENGKKKKNRIQTNTYFMNSTCPLCRRPETADDFNYRSKQSLALELSSALETLKHYGIVKLINPKEEVLRNPRARHGVRAPRVAVATTTREERNAEIRATLVGTRLEGRFDMEVPRVPQEPMDDLSRDLIEQILREDGIAAPAPVVEQVAAPAPVIEEPIAFDDLFDFGPILGLPSLDDVLAAPVPVVEPIQALPVTTNDEPIHAYGLLQNPHRPRMRRARTQPRTDMCVNANRGCYTRKTKMRCSRCAVILCRGCQHSCPCAQVVVHAVVDAI